MRLFVGLLVVASYCVPIDHDTCASDDICRTVLPPSLEYWETRTEIVPSWVFPEEEVHLEERFMFANSRTVVYGIVGHDDMVVKYDLYCPSQREGLYGNNTLDTENGVVAEAYFLNYVYSRLPEITHRFIYLSDSMDVERKSEFKTPKMIKSLCKPGQDGAPVTIRFLITERVGKSIYHYVPEVKRIPFFRAIKYEIEIFQLQQKLHNIDIVHGDMHPGNVAFKTEPGSKLVLIDFGLSAFRPTSDLSRPKPDKPDGRAWYSPWEAVRADYRPNFRDDAFRATLLLGLMIYGRSHMDVATRMCGRGSKSEHVEEYMQFKATQNFLDITMVSPKPKHAKAPKVFDFTLKSVLPEYALVHIDAIRSHLAKVLSYMQGLQFDNRVDYELVFGELNAILEYEVKLN